MFGSVGLGIDFFDSSAAGTLQKCLAFLHSYRVARASKVRVQ